MAKDTSKLTKKRITDKTGKQTFVWVKTAQEEKPEKKSAKPTEEEKKESEYTKWGGAGFSREEMVKRQKQAVKALKSHNDTFEATKKEIEELVKGAEVKGRVKEADSASFKVNVRDPHHYKGDVGKLKDATGFMAIRDSVKDVEKDMKALTGKYEVVEQKDYVTKPKGDYRAVHLILKDATGKMFEVQLKTKNQATWAMWAHDIYKPMSDSQAETLTKSGGEIRDYGHAMSEYFAKVDGGEKKAVMPPCIEVVASTFGCLP